MMRGPRTFDARGDRLPRTILPGLAPPNYPVAGGYSDQQAFALRKGALRRPEPLPAERRFEHERPDFRDLHSCLLFRDNMQESSPGNSTRK